MSSEVNSVYITTEGLVMEIGSGERTRGLYVKIDRRRT